MVKRIGKWLLVLHKRLYKKAVFAALLVLVLLSALLLYTASLQENGFVRVLLVQEDPADGISSQIVADCMQGNRLLIFEECATKELALERVKTGSADAAWIFPADMQKHIDQFVEEREKHSFVTVIEREQTISLRLSREKLASILYSHCSPTIYIAYLREHFPQLDTVMDADLLSHYEAFEVNAPLFSFHYPDGDVTSPDIGYLIAPVRGLLSVLVAVCGLAAAILYLQDAQKGTYSLLRMSQRPLLVFGNCMVAVFQLAVVMLISLYFIGVTVSFGRECLMLVLYTISCTLFCMVVQLLCNNPRFLAALIPLLAVAMIGVCPVFFDKRELVALQLLFPPTYYINAVHSNTFLWYMVLYCAALALLYLLLEKIFHRQK